MKRAAKRPKKPPYKVQVLDRAINILEFIGRQSSGEAALPELSAAMKLHKTTTHRIAHVLESRGLLRRGLDSNRYRLGLHLYDLGCQALDHVNIRDEARPLMTRVAYEVGETVHLALLDRAEVLYIERVEAQRSLTMGSKLGARNPVYCTALGKTILAYSAETEVDRTLTGLRMEARTRNTITNVLTLKRELERVRIAGMPSMTRKSKKAYAASPHQFSMRAVWLWPQSGFRSLIAYYAGALSAHWKDHDESRAGALHAHGTSGDRLRTAAPQTLTIDPFQSTVRLILSLTSRFRYESFAT